MDEPSATASENEKNGIPRFAFTEPSIGSTTTRRSPPAPNTRITELLRDEHEVLVEGGEPRDDGVLGRLVDRGRLVATLAELQHGLALGPRRHPRRARRGCPRRRAGRSRARASSIERVEEEPGERLGEEVRALRRHSLAAARDVEDRRRRAARGGGTPRPPRRGRPSRQRRRDAACTRCRRGRAGRRARRRARPRDRARARRSRVDTRPPPGVRTASSSRRSNASSRSRQGSPSRSSSRSGLSAKTRCVGNTCNPASSFDTTSAMIRTPRSPASAPSSTALS